LKAFLPSMIKKNHGHIVAVSSVGGLIGIPYATIYCPSKFAVNGNSYLIFNDYNIIQKNEIILY